MCRLPAGQGDGDGAEGLTKKEIGVRATAGGRGSSFLSAGTG